MSDEYDDDDTNERLVTLSREQIKALEKQAKSATDALSRAEAAERKLAFAEAGINPREDPRLNYFMDGYKGEMTPEAIRAKAVEDKFLLADEKQDAQANDDAAALGRMADGAANAGSLPTGADAAYERVMATTTRDAFYDQAIAAGLAT